MEQIFEAWFLCWFLYWVSVALLCDDGLSEKRAHRLVDASKVVSVLFNTWSGWYALRLHLMGSGSVDFLLNVSLGYFAWDAMICAILLWQGLRVGVDMTLHAVLCACGIAFSLAHGFCKPEAASLLMVELSTPFLNLLQLSQARHWFGSIAQLIWGALFLCVFAVVRLLWCTYFVFSTVLPRVLSHENRTLAFIGAGTVLSLCALNAHWGVKIAKSLRKS